MTADVTADLTACAPPEAPTAGVFRDASGNAHVRAADPLALARAQGLVVALDLAWQLEVRRHGLLGTSASFLGADALPRDRFARRARPADTARRAFDALARRDPATAGWVRTYVDGVNAGLPEGARRATEFARTGLVPGRWEPWVPLGIWLDVAFPELGFRGTGPALVEAGSDPAATRAYQPIRLACPEFDVAGLAAPGVPGLVYADGARTRSGGGGVGWSLVAAVGGREGGRTGLCRERLRRTGAGVEALDPDGVWRRATRRTERIAVASDRSAATDTVDVEKVEGVQEIEQIEEIEVVETVRGPVVVGGPDGLEDGVADPAAPVALGLRRPSRMPPDLGFGALPALLRARSEEDVARATAVVRSTRAVSEPVGEAVAPPVTTDWTVLTHVFDA